MFQQLPGRGIMFLADFAAFQFINDYFRQLFSQFHTPLIECIDIPQAGLHESAVFIQGEQLPEHVGCQAVIEDGCAGTVAGKMPPGFTSNGVPAKHQGFSLGQTIGNQFELVPGMTAVGVHTGQEFHRNVSGTLVQ
jgi:hypothetical protein